MVFSHDLNRKYKNICSAGMETLLMHNWQKILWDIHRDTELRMPHVTDNLRVDIILYMVCYYNPIGMTKSKCIIYNLF